MRIRDTSKLPKNLRDQIKSSQSLKPKQRSKGGKRVDLDNKYFRSAWEANYARYLNYLIENPSMMAPQILKWEYEPDTFEFEKIKRGNKFYTPDFKIYYKAFSYRDGSTHFIKYHEIKGYMDAGSATKLKRMVKYYPQYPIQIIGRKEYQSIAKTVSKLIPCWE